MNIEPFYFGNCPSTLKEPPSHRTMPSTLRVRGRSLKSISWRQQGQLAELIFVEWATSTMISPHCVLRPGTELVVVVGAGGHGKVVADALSLMVWDEIDGFIDCNEAIQGTCVLGRPVIAGHDWLFREAEARLIAVAWALARNSIGSVCGGNAPRTESNCSQSFIRRRLLLPLP